MPFGPGNYGLFPVQFLPIFWPHYSLFTREKIVHFIIYKIVPSFFKRFPPHFLILIGLHRMTSFFQRIKTRLSFVAVKGKETSPIYYSRPLLIFLTGIYMTYMYNDVSLAYVPVEGQYNKFTVALHFL